jgi:hypothetical protein
MNSAFVQDHHPSHPRPELLEKVQWHSHSTGSNHKKSGPSMSRTSPSPLLIDMPIALATFNRMAVRRGLRYDERTHTDQLCLTIVSKCTARYLRGFLSIA